MTLISEPVDIFYDTDGTPLENGMVYVGEEGLDARANPIQVYWDEARTITASQPIRTLAGRPAYQGTATNVFVSQSAYSVSVYNKNGTPILVNADGIPGVLAIELAAAGGADMVGTNARFGSATYLKNVSLLLSGQSFPILSNIPEAQHAAIIAGTSTYDAKSAVQEILDDLPVFPYGKGASLEVPPGGLMIASKLTLTNKNSVKFTGHSTNYINSNNIKTLPGYTDGPIIDLVGCADISFDGVCLSHLGRTTVGSIGIKAYQEAADVDIVFRNGIIGNAELGIDIYGRGLLLQNYSLNALNGGVRFDWPNPLVLSPEEMLDPVLAAQNGHSAASGMRAYRFENGRCHAWAGGFLFVNTGANSANFMGAEITGLYCDTNMRFWDGDMPYTTIDAVNMQTLTGTNAIFDVDSCQGSSVRGLFRGQNDPAPYTRQMGIFAVFRNADGFLFDGYVERVTGRTIVISGGDNWEVNLRGKDLSLDAASSPIQLAGTIGSGKIGGGIETAGAGQEWVDIAAGATVAGPINLSGIRLTSGWRLTDWLGQGNWTSLGTLADDTATSVAIPGKVTAGKFEIFVNTGGNPRAATGLYRHDGTVGLVSLAGSREGGTDHFLGFGSTGTLAGTTGGDGTINFRVDTANNLLYVENRDGGSRTVLIRFVAS